MVLGLLVLSLLIFTSFFREGEGGFLHQVKGTVGAVVAPVQEGAVAAVQPLKDGWNWFAELRTARDERNRLRAENAALQAQIVAQQVSGEQADQFRKLLDLQDEGPEGYAPVNARVVVRPADLSQRVQLDKGTSDGIVVNSLVFAPQTEATTFGVLVGIVTSATRTSSTVTFLTDPSTSVGARLLASAKPLGLLKATSSGQLILDKVPAETRVREGDTVVTAGYGTPTLMSPYPPGLMIGRVTSRGSARGEPGEFQTVQVTPFRDPLDLSTFTVFVPKSPQAKKRAGA